MKPSNPFDGPVVRLDEIVQVFALADVDGLAGLPSSASRVAVLISLWSTAILMRGGRHVRRALPLSLQNYDNSADRPGTSVQQA